MDFALPELGEGVYEAELSEWRVRPGETVKRGQTLMEVITDKASMEVPAPFAGQILTLSAAEGDEIKVGDVILTYDPGSANGSAAPAEPEPIAEQMPEPDVQQETSETDEKKVIAKASPSVRRMARSLGVDPADITGSGPGGRVLIDDVSKHVRQSAVLSGAPRETPLFEFGKPGATVMVKGLRKTIAQRMTESYHTIPQVTYVDECDVSELVRLRDSLKVSFDLAGIRLTYLPFFIKAVVLALQDVPVLNASYRGDTQSITLHDRYDIGFAVATQRGLLVPVLKEADEKPLTDLAQEIDALGQSARAGMLDRNALTGSTFTVTSIGNFGGLFSTPMINGNEAGILGFGKIVKRPVYDEADQIRPAHMLYLSLTFDHRLLDGDAAATFCNAVMHHLQHPARLLLPSLIRRR